MRWPWRRRARHAAATLPRPGGWAVAAQPPSFAVRLGFVDGSELDLLPGDPRAVALAAVADLLVQDPAAGADNKSNAASLAARTRAQMRRTG
jgi:hypothetical protein